MIRSNRINIATAGLIVAGLLLGLPVSNAQQTTEQFIPIGSSPGISDRYSYIGTIVSLDRVAGTMVVESNRGTKTLKVTPATRIWLDRSKSRKTNPAGTYEDCEVGRSVEVMYDHDDESAAAWIKIEDP